MRAAYEVELLKLRRSRVVQVTTVILLVVPCLMAAAFVAAAGHGTSDPMSLKAAALVSDEGWRGYTDALVQIFSVGGLLGMGVVVAWSFAREFTDRTVVSLYASATPRHHVAGAKLVVLTAWAAAVAVALAPAALLVGMATGLGLPTTADLTALGRVIVLGVLTALSSLAAGWFASVGRGPMPAFGGLVGLIVASQVAVVLGAGPWFPWSVPGLWVVAQPGSGLTPVPLAHLLLVPGSTILVVLLTLVWWRRAELA